MAHPKSDDPSSACTAPLAAAVAALANVRPIDLADGELTESLLGLLRVRDRLDAVVAERTREFDQRLTWAGDGARSAPGWLTARAEVTRSQASGLVHLGRDLGACPAVAAAYRSGEIGTAKVWLMLKARRVDPALFDEHEAGLTGHVLPLNVAHTALVMARWADMAEATVAPSGDEVDEPEPPEDPAAANSMHLSRTFDGRWTGDLELDATSGAELDNYLTAYVDKLFNNGTYHADDGLTSGRRRADVLLELARRGADPDATHHGVPRPSVSITIDHRTLAGIPAATLDDGLARRCELDDGTPIPRTAAERALCTGRIDALLTQLTDHGTLETVGVTSLLRHATARQRKALRLRDNSCVFPGCDAPHDWCDAHHLVPFEAGGPTLMHNLVLLCRFHHHRVHEGGWRLWRDPAGQLRLNKPDSTPIATTPNGHQLNWDTHHPADPDDEPPARPPPYPQPLRFRRPAHARNSRPPDG